MAEVKDFFLTMLKIYWGTGHYQYWLALGIMAIIFIEKEKTKKLAYGIYTILVLMIILNPVAMKVMKLFFSETGGIYYFFRLFSEIPIMCVLAYGVTLLLKNAKGWLKLVLVAGISAMIVLSGSMFYYSIDWMQKAANATKLPDDVIEICEYLHTDDKIIEVAVPSEIASYVRQYDASLVMPYGRISPTWSGLLISEEPDAHLILTTAAGEGCDYVVVANSDKMKTSFALQGLEAVCATERYLVYPVKGVPGIKYEYNEKMQRISMSYIDDRGTVTLGAAGYARANYEYDEKGNNIQEMYYDIDGNPIAMAEGFYGIQRDYDKKNNVSLLTYLDVDGVPIVIDRGCAQIRYEYNDIGLVIGEMYLDTVGESVVLANGYCGTLMEYNENKQIIKLIYVDENKNPVKTVWEYAMVTYKYNEFGKQVYEAYYNSEGNPMSISSGYHGVRVEYADGIHVSTREYVDEKGDLIDIDEGYAKLQYEYNESGLVTSIMYLDSNENPVRIKGYSGILMDYNENGLLVKRTYVDEFMKPARYEYGYSITTFEYDEAGNNVYEKYYDVEGTPTAIYLGHYGVKREYDDNRNVISVTYVNIKGVPMDISLGYASVQYEYNEQGEVEKEIYLDAEGYLIEKDSRGRERTAYGYTDNYWILSNYADASGNQGGFYTLKNQKTGELIVVDGGWAENASHVRDVIDELGGHVDVWFITHFHGDHVSAFNEIYSDLQGITVDKIYTTPMDYDYYMSVLKDWDTPEAYENFLETTKNARNVVELKRGDTFEFAGLKIEIFNAYDQIVKEQSSGDIPNQTSLVFKIAGEQDSILFCGDCYGEVMSGILLEEYGDVLQSEYVQLGHHGNNSLPPSFYEVVDPEVALFDAPEWLMTDTQYSAAGLKEYFDSKGITNYSFVGEDIHYFWFK